MDLSRIAKERFNCNGRVQITRAVKRIAQIISSLQKIGLLPAHPRAVVCPADARALVDSMDQASGLALKQKFFSFPELLGEGSRWQHCFEGGDYAVFRLTAEKYHYTHSPVSGIVLDTYSVEGRYHSCNPGAAVQLLTPFSKNRRVVTILDTDCAGGRRPDVWR